MKILVFADVSIKKVLIKNYSPKRRGEEFSFFECREPRETIKKIQPVHI